MEKTKLEKLARLSGKAASKALDALGKHGFDIRGKLSAPISRVSRRAPPPKPKIGLCQLSRLLIDYVSAILPRAQAVSRMPSAIAALRMCCQRRVAAGTCWRMRDRQRRKFRSSSWPRQYCLADRVLFNPSIGRHRPLMPR